MPLLIVCEVDNDTYATAEMYMMVQKARLFEDEDVARKMLMTTDPKRHKALGRQVKSFNEATWNTRTYPLTSIIDTKSAVKIDGLSCASSNEDVAEALSSFPHFFPSN